MKFPSLFLLSCILISCSSDTRKEPTKAENAMDAARDFIRVALDGKFDEARKYLVSDSVNLNYIEVAERNYQKSDTMVKEGYRASSIRIHRTDNLNDSTTIVIYSNSYMNDHDTLRVVKINGEWRVDLKYLYEHGMDTLNKKIMRDSIQ